MTNNTKPEALRLVEQYDYGEPATYGNVWKTAVCTELRRQHARIAELEAQLEAVGAGGVSGPLYPAAPPTAQALGCGAEPPGIQALMCVISSLRDIAHFSDEEGGELMSALCVLRDWAYAQTAAFQPPPTSAEGVEHG